MDAFFAECEQEAIQDLKETYVKTQEIKHQTNEEFDNIQNAEDTPNML